MSTRVIYDAEGRLCVLGTFYKGGSEDMLFSKYDSNRSLLSQTTWGGSEKDRGLAMDVDSDNNLYITGFTRSFLAIEEDLLLIKCNSSGEIVWSTYLDLGTNKGDFGLGISTYKNQSIYVTGYYWDYNFMVGDFFKWYLAKFSTNGTLLWLETGAPIVGGGMGEDVMIDETGNAYISGYHALDDSFLMKFNENGTKLWERSWGVGGRMEWGKTLLLHEDLNVITCAGYIQNEGLFFNQYDTAGNFILSKIEPAEPLEHIENGNSKMIVDGNGNLLLPWVDRNNKAHLSKYSSITLNRIYDRKIEELTPQHGFGIAYNPKNDKIMALGNKGMNSVLLTIPDIEEPSETTYFTEVIAHYSYLMLYFGIGLLIFTILMNAKNGIEYGNNQTKQKRKNNLIYFNNALKKDENQFPKYSDDYYAVLFDKERPKPWKSERLKAEEFKRWKTVQEYLRRCEEEELERKKQDEERTRKEHEGEKQEMLRKYREEWEIHDWILHKNFDNNNDE